MNVALSDENLATLLIHDDDPFNRWEAAQKLFLKQLLDDIAHIQQGQHSRENMRLAQIFSAMLTENPDDRATLATLLTLPSPCLY